MKIRVLAADQHGIFRSGLCLLLNNQSDMEVIGEASDSADAIAQLTNARPDVLVLCNTVVAGKNGVLGEICQASPATKVLVLDPHDSYDNMRAAFVAGVHGYLVKSAPEADLLTAIRALKQGRTFINLALPDGLLQKVLGSPSVEDDGALSKREREVLGLIAQGHTNQSIAATLGLSVKTIETFRARIIAKTGLNKRSDMVRYAKQRGLDTIAVASDGAATAKKRSGKKRRQK